MDESCKDYLHKIERSSKRMQLLIEDILDFSRFSSNVDAFKETDLNDVLVSVLSDLELEIAEKNAIVEVKDLPVHSVVPSMFSQLFQNLIYNALKFQKKGTIPRISIRSEQIKGMLIPGIDKKFHYDDFNCVIVSDNGIGFEEKYADQIFVIFKRLHGSSSYEGTGIGLAICKKIADKHQGYIYAKSQPGIGSEFIIALPLVKEKKTVKQ